ncbi:MAG: SDR family oxidoreductase [Pseudomonadales bacterium]|jgi:NAD(P)-dependent dehydrogenase (short-subunit alcohol dehydrogenase family)|nr:SDR family oxidoreductase [Pseudomonadales bacterium]|tara:strand:+ start:481 stop:1248 length:768 start_codon:yes stop_codon:yes gene_type:complete
MDDLSNKTILVTGASKGIGAAIVKTLVVEGANVVAHYCSDSTGMEGVLKSLGNASVTSLQADFRSVEQVEKLWQKAIEWRGGIDVLINNAAILRFVGGIDDSDQVWNETWQETLAVNVVAPCTLMRRAVPHYRKKGGGIIISMSSWVAHRAPGTPAMIAYAASKAAVLNATKTVARHYAQDNILAYNIAPGVVRTRMSEQFAQAAGGEEAVTETLAMKEWVPPSDLADLAAFLSTGKCRHLTGATLDVNGASYLR